MEAQGSQQGLRIDASTTSCPAWWILGRDLSVRPVRFCDQRLPTPVKATGDGTGGRRCCTTRSWAMQTGSCVTGGPPEKHHLAISATDNEGKDEHVAVKDKSLYCSCAHGRDLDGALSCDLHVLQTFTIEDLTGMERSHCGRGCVNYGDKMKMLWMEKEETTKQWPGCVREVFRSATPLFTCSEQQSENSAGIFPPSRFLSSLLDKEAAARSFRSGIYIFLLHVFSLTACLVGRRGSEGMDARKPSVFWVCHTWQQSDRPLDECY